MQTFTTILYRLLSNPEYVEPLRHEVETAVSEEGWTKAAMGKMYKMDSFVRETERVGEPASRPLVYLRRTSVIDALLSSFSAAHSSCTSSIHIF